MDDPMNWPIKESWKCETCEGEGTLIWTVVFGRAVCNQCGTPYEMSRTFYSKLEGKQVTEMRKTPRNCLTSPKAGQEVWKMTGENLFNASEETWDKAYEKWKK